MQIKKMQHQRENTLQLLIAYNALKKEYYKIVFFLHNFKKYREYLAQEKLYNRKTMQAEIIGHIRKKDKKTIFINKGKRDGLTLGMVVVSGITILGKIITLFDSYGEVLLLDDEKQFISVIFEGSRFRGIARGIRKTNDKTMAITYLYDDLIREPQKGELVFSSGQGFVFPEGYVIGRVHSVESFAYGEKIIYIKNEYDLEKIIDCQIVLDDETERKLEREIKQIK